MTSRRLERHLGRKRGSRRRGRNCRAGRRLWRAVSSIRARPGPDGRQACRVPPQSWQFSLRRLRACDLAEARRAYRKHGVVAAGVGVRCDPGVRPELDVWTHVITLLALADALRPSLGSTRAPARRSGRPHRAADPARPGDATSARPERPQRERGTLIRFTGLPRASIVFGASTRGRDLGGGLFDPALRNPDYLVAASGSRVSWRKPLADIFGAGSTTDTGWNFARDTKLGLFIGSVGFKPLQETKTTATLDLSKAVTAGFRISDGSVVWRNPGASYACGICVDPTSAIVQTQPQPVPGRGVACARSVRWSHIRRSVLDLT